MKNLIANLDFVLAFDRVKPLVLNMMYMNRCAEVRICRYFENCNRAASVSPGYFDSDIAGRLRRAVTVGRYKDGFVKLASEFVGASLCCESLVVCGRLLWAQATIDNPAT